MCYLYTSRPSLLFSVELKGFTFQENSIFILHISTDKPISLVRGILNEDKQTRHLVSFDPANFEMSKIYQGNFPSLCCLAQLFLNTSAVIFQKKSEIVGGNFFSSSENAIWSILLKYQEIDVQIQTFTDES